MSAAADLLVRVKGDTSDVNSKLGALGSGLGKLGKLAAGAALAGGVALGAMGVKGLIAFTGFSKGMKEVFTLLPDISKQAMGEMEDQVLDLSKKMGVLPDTVIPALYQAISAGVPTENVFDFMELASKASIGGVTDLETAVDGITSTVNAFGSEVITATEASDLMLTSVRLGKTTFGELSQSLFQVNPVAAGLGVEFSNVTAALAALTSQGVPTRVAATQIRQALVELGKDGSAASDTFKELSGVSFTEFIAAGGNMKGAFDLMAEGADDLGVGVGDLFGSVEAGMAVIALTSDAGAAKFGESLEAMRDASGATQTAFDTMDEGLGRSWDKIKAQGAAAFITLGAAIAPVVEKLLDWFMDKLPVAIEWVKTTWEKWKPTIDAIVEWLGVAIPAAIQTMMAVWNTIAPIIANIWGNISSAISTVVSWFSSDKGQGQIGSTIETIQGYFAGFMEFIGPLWDTIVEIISVAVEVISTVVELVVRGILALWENHGERIMSTVKQVFNTIRDVIEGVMRVVQGILNVVMGILTGDWDRAWTGIKMILTGVWDAITAILRSAWELIETIVLLGLDIIGNVMSTAWEAFRTAVQAAWEGIKTVISEALNKVWATVTEIFGKVVTTVKETFNNITTTIRDTLTALPGIILGFVTNLVKAGVSLGAGIISGILSGVGGLASSLYNKLKDGIGGAIDSAKSFFGISSPSKLMATQIGEPLAAGITGPVRTAIDWAVNIAPPVAVAATPEVAAPTTIILQVGDSELGRWVLDLAGMDRQTVRTA